MILLGFRIYFSLLKSLLLKFKVDLGWLLNLITPVYVSHPLDQLRRTLF